jgi:hypothetical protein
MSVRHTVTTPIDVTITPGTTQFTANDVMGGALTFTPTARRGVIVGLTVVDDDNEGAALVLELFESITTDIDNNDAFAPVLADLAASMGNITVGTGDYDTYNSLKKAYVPLSTPIPYYGAFQGYLLPTGTPTYGSGKVVKLRLHIVGEN